MKRRIQIALTMIMASAMAMGQEPPLVTAPITQPAAAVVPAPYAGVALCNATTRVPLGQTRLVVAVDGDQSTGKAALRAVPIIGIFGLESYKVRYRTSGDPCAVAPEGLTEIRMPGYDHSRALAIGNKGITMVRLVNVDGMWTVCDGDEKILKEHFTGISAKLSSAPDGVPTMALDKPLSPGRYALVFNVLRAMVCYEFEVR